MTMISEVCKVTPVEDLLAEVPFEALLQVKDREPALREWISTHNIPIGRLSKEAVEKIHNLQTKLAEAEHRVSNWEDTARLYAENANYWRQRVNQQVELSAFAMQQLATSLSVGHLIAGTPGAPLDCRPQQVTPPPSVGGWVEVSQKK
jgi:hypothetical protein